MGMRLIGSLVTGSTEESVTIELARRLSSQRQVTVPESSAKDIEFSFNTDMQRTGDFSVTLSMKNTSDESRLVDVHISALSCKYTGIANADIKDTSTATVLEPNARKCLHDCVILPSDYRESGTVVSFSAPFSLVSLPLFSLLSSSFFLPFTPSHFLPPLFSISLYSFSLLPSSPLPPLSPSLTSSLLPPAPSVMVKR